MLSKVLVVASCSFLSVVVLLFQHHMCCQLCHTTHAFRFLQLSRLLKSDYFDAKLEFECLSLGISQRAEGRQTDSDVNSARVK